MVTPISIHIGWSASQSEDVYYEVTYRELFDVIDNLVATVSSTDLMALLEGLTPSIEYLISVRSVITRSGITAKSEPATIQESTRKDYFFLSLVVKKRKLMNRIC